MGKGDKDSEPAYPSAILQASDWFYWGGVFALITAGMVAMAITFAVVANDASVPYWAHYVFRWLLILFLIALGGLWCCGVAKMVLRARRTHGVVTLGSLLLMLLLPPVGAVYYYFVRK